MDSWSDATGSAETPSTRSSVRAMTLGEILDGMFRLLIAHWRVFLLAVGVILTVYNVVSSWLATQATGISPMDMLRAPQTLSESAGSGAAAAWLNVLRVISVLVVTPFTVGAACLIAAEGIEGRTPTTGGIWRGTLRRFWPLVGLTLISAVIGLVLAGVLALLGGMVMATLSSAVAVVYVVMVLFAVAAIVTYLCMSYPALMVEDLGPGRAVSRALGLVRGRFWRTLGTLVLVFIIMVVLVFVIFFAFTLPGFALGEEGTLILAFLAATVASVVTVPLTTNAVTLLYYDARVRDEAYDLDVRTADAPDPSQTLPDQPFG